MTLFTDSDWAGDQATRKSTTCGAVMLGGHLVKSWCKDQSVVALSSGEAELYSANYGAAQAMGIQSMCADLGVKIGIDMFIDAKATMGIVNRRGLGKVRHISVQSLWLQDAVRKEKLKLMKGDWDSNVADMMTKALAGPDIERFMNIMGML